jgi:phosphate transport system ATP-binding protein
MEKVIVQNLSLHYSDGNESLKNINLTIHANAVNVLFGPAGGGKSTLLRVMNRLNDLADVKAVTGKVLFNGKNVLDEDVDVIQLRRKIGMVFSRPLPLPLSIYDNITYGLKMAGEKNKAKLDTLVEQSLKQAMLWDEVHDRLHSPGSALSGGQKQRLCLARTLALEPEIILLDEPTSALDPVATSKIEGMLQELKQSLTVVLVPHNTQQAARTADYASFFLQGEMVETGLGEDIFTNPQDPRTQDYVRGRFG